MDSLKGFIQETDFKKKFNAVKYTVLNVSPLEAKVRECTSNDPWGASGSDKQLVAEHTFNYEDFKVVMSTIWKRLNDNGKNWRHVHKGLQLLEFLLIHGSERVIDEARDQSFTIQTLRNFKYVDEKGKDQGAGIRELSKKLVDLLKNDKEISRMRKEASKSKDKYSGISASEARFSSRSQSSRKTQGSSSSSSRRGDADNASSADDEGQRCADDNGFGDDDGFGRVDGGEAAAPSGGRMRAPSFGESNAQARPAAQPKQREANLFDVDDFFGGSSAQPAQQQQQQFAPAGFNPRAGAAAQPAAHDGWDADFDNGFGAPAQTQGQPAPVDNGASLGFDDAFPDQDEFNTFQQGNIQEKKDDIWDLGKGLVKLDLNDNGQQKAQQNQAKKVTLNDLKKQQGTAPVSSPYAGPTMRAPVAGPAYGAAPYGAAPAGYPQQPAAYGYGSPAAFGSPAGYGAPAYGAYPAQQQQQQQPARPAAAPRSNDPFSF